MTGEGPPVIDLTRTISETYVTGPDGADGPEDAVILDEEHPPGAQGGQGAPDSPTYDQEADLYVQSGVRYRVNRRGLGLTYPAPRDEDDNPIPNCDVLLRTILDKYPGVEQWIVCEEIHENGKRHYHLGLFKNAAFDCGIERFTVCGVRPNIVRGAVAEFTGQKSFWTYCMKQGDWRASDSVERHIEVRLEVPVFPSDGWQHQVIRMISGKPDERSIMWFFSESGSIGKTQFVKRWLIEHRSTSTYLSGAGKDMNYALSAVLNPTKKEKNWKMPNLTHIFIDLPRSMYGENDKFLSYGAIEKIKDGIVFNSKYESGMLLFNCPWVICFSNVEPEYEKLSNRDTGGNRWNVYKIRASGIQGLEKVY